MLKVKRLIQPHYSKNDLEEWQNDIKNAIKGLYIKTKEDSKTINRYSEAVQKVKNEYALLYKENQELKKINQQLKQQKIIPQNYQNYNQLPQHQLPQKRHFSRYHYENEDTDKVQYIVRKKRKTPKTKIIYEEEDMSDNENDAVDGKENNEDGKIEESIEKRN